MTFSNSSLASQTNTSKISSKPLLIERSTKNSLGTDIKLVEVKSISQISEKSFSPRLLNYVEPYEKLSTGTYTTFYTEFNSGLKVGDRVFIINGNYDSDILIKKDKYRKGRDGYKILEIENCKITLDIEFTGQSPWNDEDIDNFIGLYYVQNYQDFIHANNEFVISCCTSKRCKCKREIEARTNHTPCIGKFENSFWAMDAAITAIFHATKWNRCDGSERNY